MEIRQEGPESRRKTGEKYKKYRGITKEQTPAEYFVAHQDEDTSRQVLTAEHLCCSGFSPMNGWR